MSNTKVQRMFGEVCSHLEELSKLFVGSPKVTFIARFDGFPEQDVLIGDDAPAEIIKLLERRIQAISDVAAITKETPNA